MTHSTNWKKWLNSLAKTRAWSMSISVKCFTHRSKSVWEEHAISLMWPTTWNSTYPEATTTQAASKSHSRSTRYQIATFLLTLEALRLTSTLSMVTQFALLKAHSKTIKLRCPKTCLLLARPMSSTSSSWTSIAPMELASSLTQMRTMVNST